VSKGILRDGRGGGTAWGEDGLVGVRELEASPHLPHVEEKVGKETPIPNLQARTHISASLGIEKCARPLVGVWETATVCFTADVWSGRRGWGSLKSCGFKYKLPLSFKLHLALVLLSLFK
jgi:hypothetical protein